MTVPDDSRLGGRHAVAKADLTMTRLPELRFIMTGNRRGLAVISIFALTTAFSEAFLLAAVVQSLSVISGGGTSVGLNAGPFSVRVAVTTLLAFAILAALVRGTCVAVIAFFGPRVAAASRERHRRALFEAYLSANWSTQSADKTGRFLQTLSSAVNDANTIVSLATQALPALLTLVVLVGLSLVLSPVVTLVLVCLGVLIALVLRPVSKRAYSAARADAAGRNATASHVAGVITAGSEVAVLGSRQGVIDVGVERIGAAERSYAKAQGLQRLVSMAGQSIAFLLAAAGLWVLTVSDLDVNFATIGTIAVLLVRGAGLAQQVQSATTQYGAITPFINQVRTLIQHYQTNRQTYGDVAFPVGAGITIQDASYVYPGTTRTAVYVEHAAFPPGSSTGVIGPSGSGKSTLIQLILRLRPPTSGAITFGDIEAAAISDTAFTANVAYVPQSPHLVPGTIADNIRFFRGGITDSQVREAAERAHVHDDILRMPHAYETVLDAHVDTLSGGQKQRLALARALACHPAVLVLDEPTSALDAANETAVMDTLRQLHGHTTVIMITHKASTLAHCDSVLTLGGGVLRETSDAAIEELPVPQTKPAVT